MGLFLKNTEALTTLLMEASTSTTVAQEKQERAAELAKQDKIPWRELRPIYVTFREGKAPEEGPWLHEACQGGGLFLEQPPERKKSPELLARLELLQRQDEERRYNAMVHDVTHTERKAEAAKVGGIVAYKDQVSYGLHIIVVMGVFYVMGHFAASRLSQKPAIRIAGGLLGLILAMLMEAVLLIVRTNEKSSRPRVQRLMVRTGPEGAPLATSDRSYTRQISKVRIADPLGKEQEQNSKAAGAKKDE